MYASISGKWLGHGVVFLVGANFFGPTLRSRKSYSRSHICVGIVLTLFVYIASLNHCVAANTTLTLSDTFMSLDENIWSLSSYQACNAASDASCRYNGSGTLYINGEGSSAMMTMAGSWASVSNVQYTIVKTTSCSDQFLMISKLDEASIYWDWSSVTDTAVFVWDCDVKTIIPSSSTTSSTQSCSIYTTYKVEVTIENNAVSFYDPLCGTITALDSIGASSDPLFVYIGSDSDVYGSGTYSDGQWTSFEISGTCTALWCLLPTPTPTLTPFPSVSVAPAISPSQVPTLQPSPNYLTLSQDISCSTAGCAASATFSGNYDFSAATLSITNLFGDFASSSEYADVFVNGVDTFVDCSTGNDCGAPDVHERH
jgi:hypothetical protein